MAPVHFSIILEHLAGLVGISHNSERFDYHSHNLPKFAKGEGPKPGNRETNMLQDVASLRKALDAKCGAKLDGECPLTERLRNLGRKLKTTVLLGDTRPSRESRVNCA